MSQTLPRLEALSFEDPLTGMKNRRYFDRQYEREWNRSIRRSSQLTLLCIDIDRFKEFNDAYGHPEGDHCLKLVSAALATTVVREFDCVCRIGGEEFAMLLPMTETAGGARIARQAVRAVRQLAIAHPSGGVVTVSVGVGTCQPHRHSGPDGFFRQVDKALYQAKALGRDRCVAATPEVERALQLIASTQEDAIAASPGVWPGD